MLKKDYLNRLVDKRLDFYLSTFGAVCVEGPKLSENDLRSLDPNEKEKSRNSRVHGPEF